VTLSVEPAAIRPPEAALERARANISSRVALIEGRTSGRGQSATAPWVEPLTLHPGDTIQVWLTWRVLSQVDESYTVFVHLIDGTGRPWAQDDYTPMGGAFPTFLWIPRWIEGQAFSDPYRLDIPPETPPGDYLLEIGMYGMTSLRRAQHFDHDGNLAGDRHILGPVRITAP
jgi:hypothetical protein